MGLGVGRPSLAVLVGWLRGVALLGVGALGSWGTLGLARVRRLLLARVWWRAMLPIVALTLLAVARWALLSIS